MLPKTMKEYLIFRIYGMMASWGDIAIRDFRPSFDHPSKSAIMGMVAAAIGIRRDEEERLSELAAGYLMAVRIETTGILMRDFHTAQVPPLKKIDGNEIVFPTRKAELSVPIDKAIISERDYRCDAVYSVCLWCRTASPPYPLTILKGHLEKPTFNLYLGRKSCPPSLPLEPQVVLADTISNVFSSVQFHDGLFLTGLEYDRDIRIFWEGDDDAGFAREQTIQRRDEPLSRRRWQFGSRTEHYAMIKKPAGG